MDLGLLERKIKKGVLHLHMPDGSVHRFGHGGREAHWYIRRESALRRTATDAALELGQTYMEEGWDSGDFSLRDLLHVLRSNFEIDNRRWYQPLVKLYRRVNEIASSYRDIASHYDVDEFVFRHFLDREMYYSCAYFRDSRVSLEQAQFDKAEHIARKLLLAPGQRVLDIGCGWGSLAFHLASRYQVEVVGITLSREQLRVARDEARRRKLAGVSFELADYREHEGRYDRIVSVGMLEHVGVDNLATYFDRVDRMLADDGVALVHSIGNRGTAKPNNPWMEKYIFPGGQIPTLGQIAAAVEESTLLPADVEVLRLHYAWTLGHWFERFRANREAVRALKGETFCRMWEFYLAACESAFACHDLVVYQYQLARGHGVVPVTRDYLYGKERPATQGAGRHSTHEGEMSLGLREG